MHYSRELFIRDKNGVNCNPLPGQLVRGDKRVFRVKGVGWRGEKRTSFCLVELNLEEETEINVKADVFVKQVRDGAMVWEEIKNVELRIKN